MTFLAFQQQMQKLQSNEAAGINGALISFYALNA